MSIEPENVDKRGVRFELEKKAPDAYRLIYVDGVAEDVGDARDLKVYHTPTFVHAGRRYQLVPAAWVWDRKADKLGRPGTSEWHPLVRVGPPTDSLLWGIFSRTCAGRGHSCVLVGRPIDVCLAFLDGKDYADGFSPELPALMGYPAGCLK